MQLYPNPIGNGSRLWTGALSINGLAEPLGYTLKVTGNVTQSRSSGPLTWLANNTSLVGTDTVLHQLQAGPGIGRMVVGNAATPPIVTGNPTGLQFVLHGVSATPLTLATNNIARQIITSAGNVSINAPDSGVGLTVNGLGLNYGLVLTAPNSTGQSFGLRISAGTNLADTPITIEAASNNIPMFRMHGDGSFFFQPSGFGALPTLVGDSTGLLSTYDQADNGPYDLGYRDSPLNVQNVSYTFALSDRGKTVNRSGGAGAINWNIPGHVNVPYPIGTVIDLVGVPGVGNVTLAPSGFTTLVWLPSGVGGLGAAGNRVLSGSSFHARIWQQTQDAWYLWGEGIS